MTIRRAWVRTRKRVQNGPAAQAWLLAALALGVGLVLLFVVGWNLPYAGRVQVRPGQVAPFDMVSPRQITYVSELLTQQARERAANAVPDQYESAQGSVRRQQVVRARELMAEITMLRDDPAQSEEQKLDALLAIADLGLTAEAAVALLELPAEQWAQVTAETPVALDRVMRSDVRPDMVLTVQRSVPSAISADLGEAASTVAALLVQALIRPNNFFNEERTLQMREEAAAAIPLQTQSIERGQTILRAGDIATPEDIEALAQIGLVGGQWDWWSFLRALVFSISLLAVTLGALFRVKSRTPHRLREAAILALLSATWLVAAKLMIVPHDWLPYLYPMAALSMLLACLVHVRTAIVATVALALVAHYLGGTNPALVVYFVLGGLAGALVIGRAERLAAFLWGALAVAGANLLALLAYRLPFEAMSSNQVLQVIFVVLLNGGLSASIALLGYFGLGNLFGLTTSLQLNELSRPTHPLLRQLLLKASGTYHHTIVVSNLAERAAAAIGADALLARVGAYYHDIGKTVRPYFFTENINDDASPHDKLDPVTSAQIIISHVRDGLDLAQKYRLPRRIQDFIREHHGRSLVQYFYHRALRDATPGESVDEEEFRYPGPRPHSKETAVLALADTCEAAVRAMRPASREELAALINRLIDERVAEGELNESNLTFKDLQDVREVFIQVLQGVHHPRISYPEPLRIEPPLEAVAPLPVTEPALLGAGPAEIDAGSTATVVDGHADEPNPAGQNGALRDGPLRDGTAGSAGDNAAGKAESKAESKADGSESAAMISVDKAG